jgi:hypothetical protein
MAACRFHVPLASRSSEQRCLLGLRWLRGDDVARDGNRAPILPSLRPVHRAAAVEAREKRVDGEGNFQRQFTIDVPVPLGAKAAIGYAPDEAAIAAGTFAPGSPWAICISPGPNQVLYSADAFPGRIYKMTLDGKLLGVLGESGKQIKQFGWIHQMSCPSQNVLFVAELLNWRVQKLVLHA